MQSSSSSASLRRSSRVPASIPILVTSLDPHAQFSEVCETLVVNAHGCALRSSAKLDAGVVVHFHSKDGRETTARVVSCQRLNADKPGWQLGARLDRPQNFWGLHTFPHDWPQLTAGNSSTGALTANSTALVPAKSSAKNFRAIRPPAEKIPASLKTMLDQLQKQVSDERLQSIVAEAIRPVFIEMAELRERLARNKERSKFEVSLSHIPPELQVLIGDRLRKELEPLVTGEARSQSAALLASAKSTIEKKTADSHTEFRQKVSEDLRTVEKRVQSVAAETTEALQNHLRRQMGEFHEHVTGAGQRLKKLNEGLLENQQQQIAELWEAHRRELEQTRAALASDSARLQAQVADLDARIARLSQSAHALESGLDTRLSKLATSVVSGTRTQLENTVEALLEELKAQSIQQLEADLEEARLRQEKIRDGMEHAISESMWLHEAGMLKTFEKNVEEVARQSVERYRSALATGFQALMQNLGAHFQQETDEPLSKTSRHDDTDA
jgi:gas vesicle protein